MKKIVIGTILVVLLLCSCEQMFYDNSSLSAPDIESANSQIYVSNHSLGFNNVSDSESSLPNDESSVYIEDEESSAYSEDETSAPDDISEESEIRDSINAYPLLLIDTTDMRNDKAYLLCGFNEEGIVSAYDFSYNGKELLDYLEIQGEKVETRIIDTSKNLLFKNSEGNNINADMSYIYCYGEPIIEEVHVCPEIVSDSIVSGERYLGTYADVNIFPDTIRYTENSVTVDIDSDGKDEIIRWEFSPAKDRDGYFHYSVSVEVNGKNIALCDNLQWKPLEKKDLEIFVADIDMNDCFEILVYSKLDSIFNGVNIYSIDESGSELIHFYTITPEP